LNITEFGSIPLCNIKNFLICVAVGFAMFGCAVRGAIPTVEASLANKVIGVSMGQTKQQVEAIMRQTSDTFTLALRPNEWLQAWRYEERGESMCLFVTYDGNERVIDITPIQKERGRNPMPLPGAC
jgi:hypothetical protein